MSNNPLVILGLALSLGIATNVNAEDYLIKNATIHTASESGVLANTDIYVSDGYIMEVAKNIQLKSSHKIIDAKGRHVTPGLINAATQIGLVEIDAASSTVDSATKNKMQGASFNIAPAVHFKSTVIPHNRMNGLTRAIVLPNGKQSIFQGQGAAISLKSSATGMLNENIAQVASYGISGGEITGGSRASAYAILDKAFEEADYLRHNRSHYLPGYDWHFSLPVADLDALKPVLERRTPLIISVNRADDILKMIELAKKHRINLVVLGGAEAWTVADELAKAKVPVIIDPILNLPDSFDALEIRLDAASILNRAGVKLLLTGIDWQFTHNGYLVRQSAGNAVAYGLPAEEAIKAMTTNTASVFGIENYGQIKVGMEADIVIWDGDPLEVTSNADDVWIKGEKQKMISRATRLRDRYWDLTNTQKKAYIK